MLFSEPVGGLEHIDVVRPLTHHDTVGSGLPHILDLVAPEHSVLAEIHALPGSEWKLACVAIVTRLSLVGVVVQLRRCFRIRVMQPTLMLLDPTITGRLLSSSMGSLLSRPNIK